MDKKLLSERDTCKPLAVRGRLEAQLAARQTERRRLLDAVLHQALNPVA